MMVGRGHDDGMVHLFLSEDDWRWMAGTGQERAGGEVAASRLAEPCEQGTGGRDHSQWDWGPRVPEDSDRGGGRVPSQRGPGLRGTWAEDREQTQQNPYGICPETTSQQLAGQTHVFGS